MLSGIKIFNFFVSDHLNDLYQAAVISVFSIGYSMLGKKILNITPPSIQKFNLNETGS